MFCSIIIPTVGRSSLAKSVHSVLEQNFCEADYEIIIVNDSGTPLLAEDWQRSDHVRIICTQKRERCVARNTGAAIAKGNYFCFLDDDDWLLPDALSHFWSLAQQHPASAWLYGGTQFVNHEGKTLGILNQGKTGNCFVEVMTETWIPIQASFIKADIFFQVGGFNPEFVGTEDLDLLRNIAFIHQLANTTKVVTCIQRGGGRKSETEYSIGWLYIAKGRDILLAEQNALARLLDSAGESAYLHGLILRNYRSSLLLNLRRHLWLEAMSRFFDGLRSCLQSLKYMFTQDYWRAATGTTPLYVSIIENPSLDYNSIEDWLFS